MPIFRKLRVYLIACFFMITFCFPPRVFADLENQSQSAPGQTDLASIRKHLVKIKADLAQIRALQDKLEQEVDVVKIRIRRAGKGSA